MSASNTSVVSAGSGSGIGSIHLTNVQFHGNAPTASPEFSGLTPMNTGSSISNNQSLSGTTPAPTKQPYLRNWFLSASSSSPNTGTAPHNIQLPHGNSVSATASPAASSLNAMSTGSSESSYQQLKPFSMQQHQSQHILDMNASPNQSPVHNSSSSSSSVPSTQHQQNSSITSNANKNHTVNGDQNCHSGKQINNNNLAEKTSIKQQSAQKQSDQQQTKQQQQPQKQQKTSRRTTSLLNLFMSNSQGNTKY